MAAALIVSSSATVCMGSVDAANKPYSVTSASSTVNLAKYDDGILIDHVVYFPKDMTASKKKYPVVVWGNGTFASWDYYEELLSKIAAGEYIVVANDDKYCGTGITESASVNFIINENKDKNSIFYNKVDVEHIGAGGLLRAE